MSSELAKFRKLVVKKCSFKKYKPGALKGKIEIASDFDEEMDEFIKEYYFAGKKTT